MKTATDLTLTPSSAGDVGVPDDVKQALLAHGRQHPGWTWLWDRLLGPVPAHQADTGAAAPQRDAHTEVAHP